jgi:hypothetical protein
MPTHQPQTHPQPYNTRCPAGSFRNGPNDWPYDPARKVRTGWLSTALTGPLPDQATLLGLLSPPSR